MAYPIGARISLLAVWHGLRPPNPCPMGRYPHLMRFLVRLERAVSSSWPAEDAGLNDTTLMQQALGLPPPWTVVGACFDAEAHRLDIDIDFAPPADY